MTSYCHYLISPSVIIVCIGGPGGCCVLLSIRFNCMLTPPSSLSLWKICAGRLKERQKFTMRLERQNARALHQLNVYRTIQKGCLYSSPIASVLVLCALCLFFFFLKLLRSEKQLNLTLGVYPSSAWLLLRWLGLKGQDLNTPVWPVPHN